MPALLMLAFADIATPCFRHYFAISCAMTLPPFHCHYACHFCFRHAIDAAIDADFHFHAAFRHAIFAFDISIIFAAAFISPHYFAFISPFSRRHAAARRC